MDFKKHFALNDVKRAEKTLANIEADMKYCQLMLEKGDFHRAKDNLYNALYRVDEMIKMSTYKENVEKIFKYISRMESFNNAMTKALNYYANKQN
ncbi:MAG: hypothetical protein ACFWT6_12145 [Virgibacillus proomii]|jgi:hypothetical protein